MNADNFSQKFIFDVDAVGSLAAYDYNDDAFGHAPHRLWVLDGATGVADRRCTRHSSDAAWLASTASGLLSSGDDKFFLQEVLSTLESSVAMAFAEELCDTGVSDVADVDMPTACLGIVQITPDALEIACVGDISIVVAIPGHAVRVFCDRGSEPFSRRTMAAWKEAQVAIQDPEARWENVRHVILENRAAVNQPGGYLAIHPVRPWARAVHVERLPRVPGTRVLFASDGLWRLVDLFDDMSPETLLDAITRDGLDPVLSRLRMREKGDSTNKHYPRVKTSDDATGLLATLRSLYKPGEDQL